MVKVNPQEALRKASEDSGVDFVSGYSGYIASNFLKDFPNRVQAINERSALAMAHMNSYLGNRSLVIVKNVGLNDGALPFRNSCDLGTNAGMVVVVGDDIRGERSENIQDSRAYADLGKTLLFEPKSPSQVYEMTQEAFRLSEKHKLPVLVRITNALNNPILIENLDPKKLERKVQKGDLNQRKWILHPKTAREISEAHDKRYKEVKDYVEDSPFNRATLNHGRGLIYSQAQDREQKRLTQDYDSVLEIGTFPVPQEVSRKFLKSVDSAEIFEDDYLEGKLKEASANVYTNVVKKNETKAGRLRNKVHYSHLFDLVRKRNPDIIIGDFGSFTLADGSPVEYGLHYGASMSSAVGASLAGLDRVYTITGDGGFTHGLYGLTEASRKNANVNYVVIDNGGISGKEPTNLNLEKLAKGNGAGFVRTLNSKDLKSVDLIEMEKNSNPSVLIVRYN